MMACLRSNLRWLVLSLILFTPLLNVHGQSLDQATVGIAWTEDGSSLLVATTDTLYVYDADDWEASPQVLPLQMNWVRSIDVLGDLVLFGNDGGVAIFNFRTGERIFYTELVRGHAAFRSEDQIITGAFGIAVLDIARPRQFRSFGGYYWPVSAFALSPTGTYAAAANGGEGGHLWKIDTGEDVAPLADANDFAFSPDESTLAYSRMYGEIYLWDLTLHQNLWQVVHHDGGGVQSVAFHSEGEVIAGAYNDGTLVLCDAETGELLDIAPVSRPVTSVIMDFGLAYSPDGNLLAAGGIDGKVYVMDVSNGRFADEPPVATLIVE